MASSKHRRVACRALTAVVILGSCATASAVEFAGGTGEPNDPYQIATAAQLTAIWASGDPTLHRKHFVLTASIDLYGTVWDEPVIPVFMGTFDGNGWTIRNLRTVGGSGGGLFGVIWDGAEVGNLGLVDAYIAPAGRCGALARDNNGRVLNCYSTGKVIGSYRAGGLVANNWGMVADSYSIATVTGGTDVGGLVGQNLGDISSCHSTGDVAGDSHVGGLAGSNMGEISSSYSTARVTGAMWLVGGLVGSNGGRIVSCYADATVLGYDMYVGGLVGDNMGAVLSCYSTGSVAGEDDVGGLVGYNGGGITTSYSVADVTDHSYAWHIGGLVGLPKAPDNCYFLAPPEGSGPDNDIGTPLTSIEMKQQASFEGWDFWGSATDGTSDSWFMPEDGYPALTWQTEITGLHEIPDVAGLPLDEAQEALIAAGFVPGDVSYDFQRTAPGGYVIRTNPSDFAAAGATVDLVVSTDQAYDWTLNDGDGTPANPYRIETAGQLESLADHPELWNRHFVLSADVDLIGRTYSMALIAPDVDDSATGFQGTPFSGAFDGQSHVIRNLTIRHIDVRHNYVGLFGMIAQGARIDGLTLLDADVEGGSGSSSYVGVLAGYNAGTITDCSATGVIHGGKGDGLVGTNAGSLTDCHADVVRT